MLEADRNLAAMCPKYWDKTEEVREEVGRNREHCRFGPHETSQSSGVRMCCMFLKGGFQLVLICSLPLESSVTQT